MRRLGLNVVSGSVAPAVKVFRDMLAQGGGRQAEDEVNIVGAAPIYDQGTAIVAVGADQNPSV